MLPALTLEEIARYSRHVLLPEIGMKGQQKLKAASVLIVGVGGLGSPVALYLAAAGIGRIGLVDPDVVDTSNLQRQVIHSTAAEGTLKVESAKQRMLEINPYIQVQTYPTAIRSDNAMDLSAGYDILVDGTDNIPSRYLLNDLAVLTHKPYVYGSIFQFEGQVSVFGLDGQPCYRCLFPEPPPAGMIPSRSTSGVMGILPGTIGTIQATEVIKLIAGIGNSLAGKLLLYDAMQMSFDLVNIRQRPGCKVCGDHPVIEKLIDYETWCGTEKDVDPGSAGSELDLEPEELAQLLSTQANSIMLVDVREPFEKNLADIPGAIQIPVSELDGRLSEFSSAGMVVFFCLSGKRSAESVLRLSKQGITNIRNLHGGIYAWIEKIDPDQIKY